jgi:hypothetical protein
MHNYLFISMYYNQLDFGVAYESISISLGAPILVSTTQTFLLLSQYLYYTHYSKYHYNYYFHIRWRGAAKRAFMI